MIVSTDSPLTCVQQRLGYVADHPQRPWTLILDNVPIWPSGHAPDLVGAARGNDGFQYAPCIGTQDLIQAITERTWSRWRQHVTAASVLVTNGAMHAITLLARYFARPGAVALVQRPVLAAVPRVLRDAGFGIVFFDADDESVARMDPPVVDTALVYLNSPNNPTGAVVSRSAVASVATLAEACGAALLCDQVYDDFGTPESDAATVEVLRRALISDRVFYLNSMSKNFGAPGLRIGWLIGNQSRVAQLSGQLERENVAVSGLSQAAAAATLRHGNDALRQAVRQTRTIWLAELAAAGLATDTTGHGTAGSSLVLRLPVADIEWFADELLTHHDLAVTTSANFAGAPPGDLAWLRLPLGCAPATIPQATAALTRALRAAGTEPVGTGHAHR